MLTPSSSFSCTRRQLRKGGHPIAGVGGPKGYTAGLLWVDPSPGLLRVRLVPLSGVALTGPLPPSAWASLLCYSHLFFATIVHTATRVRAGRRDICFMLLFVSCFGTFTLRLLPGVSRRLLLESLTSLGAGSGYGGDSKWNLA